MIKITTVFSQYTGTGYILSSHPDYATLSRFMNYWQNGYYSINPTFVILNFVELTQKTKCCFVSLSNYHGVTGQNYSYGRHLTLIFNGDANAGPNGSIKKIEFVWHSNYGDKIYWQISNV